MAYSSICNLQSAITLDRRAQLCHNTIRLATTILAIERIVADTIQEQSTMVTPTPLAPDMLIHERYRIVRPIGQGGMGAIYEAIDQRLGNTVALKQTLLSGAQLDRAFEREARLLAGLRHPALPVVSDFFADGGGRFLVMQYIPGKDF